MTRFITVTRFVAMTTDRTRKTKPVKIKEILLKFQVETFIHTCNLCAVILCYNSYRKVYGIITP